MRAASTFVARSGRASFAAPSSRRSRPTASPPPTSPRATTRSRPRASPARRRPTRPRPREAAAVIWVSQRVGAGRGLVVAAHQDAADAGARALAAGGAAVDAAVAAAFALCVVDPANCGLGGYGGFLVHAPPDGTPVLVDF